MTIGSRKPRELPLDILPERYYKDEGCELSPSCLRCPLPYCKHDVPHWFQRAAREERDTRVLCQYQETKLSVARLAVHFDISPRTVFRILHRVREEKPIPAQMTAVGRTSL
jgi:hypothetical protein